MDPWESKIQSYCEKIGASHGGVSSLSRPLTWEFYQSWLEKGYAGEMTYLHQHAEIKENPQIWKPAFRSALLFAFPYVPHPQPQPALSANRTALYAQGMDYHFWIPAQLRKIIEILQLEYPNESFETHTDSSPLLERDLGQRAALGWFGKNTCLIHPKKGSLFLIGEILTSLEFQVSSSPLPDFCGKCQKCLEACPTQALEKPHVLNATKCISYLTIESKDIPPPELRSSMGDWLFGCDICQTVCPWNQKIFKTQLEVSPQRKLSASQQSELVEELRWILTSSHNQILKKVKGTPYYRAGAKGLKRNALIVIGNRKLHELQSEVESILENPDLGELAQWALHQFSSNPT